MRFTRLLLATGLAVSIAVACVGQSTTTASPPDLVPVPATASAPTPLPTPATSGPLQLSPPINFEVGSLGKYSINGAVSGIGLFQNNAVSGNSSQEGGFSNAFIFFQKTSGWFQLYVQAGAYDTPSLGSAFISNSGSNDNLWGPVPVAYAKLVVGKNTNILIGILPTLIGAEYTFSFQNMNVERGLLWNQENADQSRSAAQPDPGQIHRLAELQRWLLLQPLQLADRCSNLRQRSPQRGLYRRRQFGTD